MEDEPGPVQRVLSTPEVIDKIFSFLDLQSIGRARQVCRKWRSVSDLYLKRRMVVKPAEHSHFRLLLKNKVQEANLLNRRLLKEPVDQLIQPLPALLVTFMLDVDWSHSLHRLWSYKCFSFEEWISFGMVLLHKMKTLSSIKVVLSEESTTAVLPLCFKELRDQLKDDKLQNERLEKFEIQIPQKLCRKELEGRLDPIVPDVFATCPNLKIFSLELGTDVADGLTMVAEKVTDVDPTVPFWSTELESYRPRVGPKLKAWFLQFLRFLLKAVDVRILLMSLEDVPLVGSEPSLFGRLKYLNLGNLTERPGLIKCLIESKVFKNVKSLQLNVNLFEKNRRLRLENLCVESVAFPSVVTILLYRNKYYAGSEPEEGIEIDNWICSNVQKMAPKVQRLIFEVFPHHSDGQSGDYQKVLYLAKSFSQLKQLVLFNCLDLSSSRTCLDKTEVVSCLTGLDSITLCALRPQILLEYCRIFLNACEETPLHSIREINLYSNYYDAQDYEVSHETETIDLTKLGVDIPDHVNVRAALWSHHMLLDLLLKPVG